MDAEERMDARNRDTDALSRETWADLDSDQAAENIRRIWDRAMDAAIAEAVRPTDRLPLLNVFAMSIGGGLRGAGILTADHLETCLDLIRKLSRAERSRDEQ